MSALLQFFLNGLVAGAIYALVASGFALIYATNRFMHFAHGVSVVSSGYMLFVFFSLLSLPFSVSVVLTLVLASLFGFGMYRLVYKPLQRKKASNVILLISSIALLILFQNLIQLFFGAQVQSIGAFERTVGGDFYGARITILQIVIVVISLVLIHVLDLFMTRSSIGKRMRAVADHKELASIVGINSNRISDYSFLIGSALAGVAGILIGLEQNLFPAMGTMLMVKGFTGAVIGGITFVPGAVFGSFLLGIVENLGIAVLPSGYKDAIAFGLLFVFLLFKPTGLFGIDKGARK